MANAQVQFTQGSTVGGDGKSVLSFVPDVQITMTDKGGSGATSYAWTIINWPAPLSSAPTIASSTSQVAYVTPTTPGIYLVKLTRVDSVSGTTTDIQFFGIADDEGHHLPVAGMTGNLTNVGGSPTLAQAAGWMGREDAGTNVLLDAYLRWLKTAAKNVQTFPLVSGKQVALSNSWKVIGALKLDPTGYPSYSQATFQVALSVTSGQTVEVRLYNVTDGGVVGDSTLTSSSTSTEVVEATVTLPSAEKLYEVHLRLGSAQGGSDEAVCSEARILLVDPVGGTYTEVGHTLDVDTFALWRFNDTVYRHALLNSAADATGNGWNLAPSTTSSWVTVPAISYGPAGVTQPARWFDGLQTNNLRRDVGSTLAAIMIDNWTIEFWVYVSALGSDMMPFEVSGVSETEAVNVLLQFVITSTGNLSFLWEYGAGVNVSFTTASSYITAGTWHHVAAAISVSGGTRTLKVYVDGAYKEQGSGTNASGGASGWVTFGYSFANSNRPFYGKICEARLSDKERSAVEIAASAAASDYRHTIDADTVAMWRLDEAPDVRDEKALYPLSAETITVGVPIGPSMLSADDRSRVMLSTSHWLHLPQSGDLRQFLLGDHTVEMWFRFSEQNAVPSGWTHASQDMLNIYGTTGESLATNFLLLLSWDTAKQLRPKFFWEYGAGVDVFILPATAIFAAEDAWLPHHLAFTKENTGTNTCTLTVYVDGVAVTDYTDNSDNPISNAGLRRAEGGTASDATWLIKGVDLVWEDVRLSDKVRSAAEILESYNRRTPHRT